jgi:hypothetical protein
MLSLYKTLLLLAVEKIRSNPKAAKALKGVEVVTVTVDGVEMTGLRVEGVVIASAKLEAKLNEALV